MADRAGGRLLVTSRQPAIAAGWRGTHVIPVGFFSVREALGCLTERLSANPAQRLGAIDLVETLGREPLALAQASAVVASSTLDCLAYRDLFVAARGPADSGRPGEPGQHRGSLTAADSDRPFLVIWSAFIRIAVCGPPLLPSC